MTQTPLAFVGVVSAATGPGADALAASFGQGPNNFRRPFSGDGSAPATHYAVAHVCSARFRGVMLAQPGAVEVDPSGPISPPADGVLALAFADRADTEHWPLLLAVTAAMGLLPVPEPVSEI